MKKLHLAKINVHLMAITNYQIEMLNVGDADAFIVYYLTEDGGEHLVLIDAGRYDDGEKVLNHLNSYYTGIPVELAIVTHPDDDHYGGFIYLLEQIQQKSKNLVPIQQFWINDPRNHISVKDVEEDIQRKTLEKRLADIYSGNKTNLLELIELLHIPYKEVFAQTIFTDVILKSGKYEKNYQCVGSDQIGFTILGPTKEYFEQQCQEFRFKHIHVQIEDEADDMIDERTFSANEKCLSQVLEDANDDQSNHNRSSIIVLFEPGDGNKFLFTGDASVDSFEKMDIPHQNKCKKVTWLKVPHHGSKHNLNTKWIKHFYAEISYISTLRIGQYVNQCTINALKNARPDAKVLSMHKNSQNDAILYHDFQNREGWSSDSIVWS